MINYDLAKQLKDAGFPQKEVYGTLCLENHKTGQEVSERVKVPTLSDLIEACGNNFLELTFGKYKQSHSKKGLWWAFITKLGFRKSFRRWLAGSTNEMGWQWTYRGEGSTPEEAVARLWLELNKK